LFSSLAHLDPQGPQTWRVLRAHHGPLDSDGSKASMWKTLAFLIALIALLLPRAKGPMCCCQNLGADRASGWL